ncbi:uncharacterized protein LOC118755515 [Rhagoletis pomonella]|uniref:uncharacterized protein LOC118755515 n=1 Tax=Rhagoletis pomonella TaxID=28610 RepID=UPI001783A734|nr:uncharacterized protein LOC118755515 [Rhagoletis pomonella]
MAELGLEQTGTVEEPRRRFSSFIQEESNNEDYQTRFEELEAKHSKPALNVTAATPSGSQGASVMQSPMPVDAFETPQPFATYPTTSLATIMDRVRKWGFKYDGGRDPLSLIERVEELAEVYEVNRDLLPRAMPELLKEKALTWFRSNNRDWRQWEDFKRDFLRFFLNSRYHETLDDEIRRSVQQQNEKFKDYVLALQSLMRHANYTSEQKLTRIYRNSRSEFQWYVKRSEFTTLEELRALDQVIGPELEPYAFAYLDDIIVISATLQEHVQHLSEVFRRLRQANLRINSEKCEFFKKQLKYLGHVVIEKGIHTDPENVAAIKELTPPTNIRELRRFLRINSWYRRFVPDFSKVAHALTSMLKTGHKWKWNDEQQTAFEALKNALTEAPVLAFPDFTQKFTLQIDASDYRLGAVLTQEIEGTERVIAYASRRLNKAELNYSPTEKECLAIVWAIRKMRPYLEGYTFTVTTDHLALKWLSKIESPSGRIARWALELQQYSFDVQYRKGKLNVVADALSRQPQETLLGSMTAGGVAVEYKWLKDKMAEVEKSPQKFPDFVIENDSIHVRGAPTLECGNLQKEHHLKTETSSHNLNEHVQIAINHSIVTYSNRYERHRYAQLY